jgi:GNAT superfamily N-acetyltransferase
MPEIRPAVAADAESIAALACRLAQSFRFSRARFDEAIPVILAAQDVALMLAVEGPDCIGYVLGSHHPTFYANGPVASVAEIVVREEDRGRGVGRDLMEAFEAWALERGCAQVTLATRRASAFYQAIGYEASAAYFVKTIGGTG